MKRCAILTCSLVLAVLIMVPSVAQAAIVSPDPTVTYWRSTSGSVGKWGTYTTTAFYNYVSAYYVRVSRVQTSVKSTHLATHRIDWCRVRATSYSSTVYDRTCYTDHWIIGMGTAYCNHYPGATVRTAANQVGASLNYDGAVATPLAGTYTTPFVYMQLGYIGY